MDSEHEKARKRYAENRQFRRRKIEYGRWYRATYKAEINEDLRRRWKTDPELRRRKRARRYGMSLEDFDALWARQGGVCAICKSSDRLCVDHCHATRKVRGFLCDGCNLGLGYFRDDPNRLRAGAAYVEAARDDQPLESE